MLYFVSPHSANGCLTNIFTLRFPDHALESKISQSNLKPQSFVSVWQSAAKLEAQLCYYISSCQEGIMAPRSIYSWNYLCCY